MSNPYQLVVFDWEGTISDTLGQIFHTIAFEANRLGFGQLDPTHSRKYVGLGLIQALRKLFPDLSLMQHEQLLHAVQQAMVSRSIDMCLIPGARDFIQRLHDAHINLAIATNKGHQSLLRALQVTELNTFFKVTRSAGQVSPKPCPQMLEEIIAEFDGTPESTLMIGSDWS
jgi:phosphoglycolate phosphatase